MSNIVNDNNTINNNPWGVDEWNPGPWYESFGSWPVSEGEVEWLDNVTWIPTEDELEAMWVLETLEVITVEWETEEQEQHRLAREAIMRRRRWRSNASH